MVSSSKDKAEKPDEKRDRVNALVARELGERLRNAVDALSGPPHRRRLNSTVEEALEVYVTKLEKDHNKGRAFPQRSAELSQGRRV